MSGVGSEGVADQQEVLRRESERRASSWHIFFRLKPPAVLRCLSRYVSSSMGKAVTGNELDKRTTQARAVVTFSTGEGGWPCLVTYVEVNSSGIHCCLIKSRQPSLTIASHMHSSWVVDLGPTSEQVLPVKIVPNLLIYQALKTRLEYVVYALHVEQCHVLRSDLSGRP